MFHSLDVLKNYKYRTDKDALIYVSEPDLKVYDEHIVFNLTQSQLRIIVVGRVSYNHVVKLNFLFHAR